MPSSIHSDTSEDTNLDEDRHGETAELLNTNVEFGGTEARKKLERKLLWKLDLRMSILIIMCVNRNSLSSTTS